jgi:hypothetical protein
MGMQSEFLIFHKMINAERIIQKREGMNEIDTFAPMKTIE